MDLILATDWLNNAYPEMEQDKDNIMPKENASWISLIDEEEKREPLGPIGEEPITSTPKKCSCSEHRQRPIPLVDHLCKKFECSAKRIARAVQGFDEGAAKLLKHLRSAQLRTAHLRTTIRNFPVCCNDLSILDAHSAPAYKGYLGITVRMHYYIKHGIRLRHPNLPCVVEFGGGDHKTFFPIEVLSIFI
ncbi:hypothetical protein niasHT_030502 [Heterodera trifolii]|uniref:Uncharacterized protein n=1 Tax=Heterodera trifolii TaxID=157864 RepID=A0ABD2J4M8_9BILA